MIIIIIGEECGDNIITVILRRLLIELQSIGSHSRKVLYQATQILHRRIYSTKAPSSAPKKRDFILRGGHAHKRTLEASPYVSIPQ